MTDESIDKQKGRGDAARASTPRTVGEALGQIVWLLSQSPLHREMKIKDVESFMPAILCEQFRIFTFGPLPGPSDVDPSALVAAGFSKQAFEQLPLGVAIWAKLSEAAEAKLEKGERLTAAEWQSGDRVWLVELISPFATKDNKLSETMLLDLMQGPFKHVAFNLHRTDPATGRRDKVRLASHVQPPTSKH